MTKAERDKLRELEKAATPGPWSVLQGGDVVILKEDRWIDERVVAGYCDGEGSPWGGREDENRADAEEVRRALAHAKLWHGDREWVLTLAAAAAAWLRERERKQGGGA